ncbi:tyrosine-type recombinase/integrase [Citrobacter freundii]|uniref:tyrosine-type recombinase/integrase n=1 Tax=Citrobacter freundii TaxID=546 RepID=UPI001BCEFFF8|nr:tyrosine-type recombinase/integrase [Citrobacter freundii]MCT4724104.1 tyrosine-type recombinase/integrase [Citrobacter freundii]MCT4749349.1 tyrosine-type recombinase/integrase [Citrobacter freundii]MDT7123630.1 tyrosine-type recombinase/integrase [Citrobacter freundii]MDT7137751.1 tyrosine-type recombinase/integrase [Citrobacter freundii]MDT7142772.1 tyrosine-type recombinase/integrase [Citrobacter freundii]
MIHTRFMHFSCTHLSHSQKDGYLWRKKLNNRTLSVSLRTRLPEIAKFRAQKLTIQYVRVKELSLPFESLRNALKSYRDRLVDDALLMVLEGGSDMSTMPLTTVYEKAVHPVSEVLEEWCEDNRADWKLRTEKLNRRSVNLFIEWAKRHSIKNVEDVTKQHIADFKRFLDERYQAPRSRQDALIKLQALFNFCIDKRDYLTANPVKGMTYSKVTSINHKTEITPSEYEKVMNTDYVKGYEDLKWLLAILWNTGMRIGEAIQLRPEDFRIVDGIKCISINTEDGKQVKNETSIRDIPISEALLQMGIWDTKPRLGWTKNNAAGSRIAFAFKQIGIEHSSHDFRYSLSNRLRDCDVADSVRYSILGHAHKTTTDRVYKTRQPLRQMLMALNKATSKNE